MSEHEGKGGSISAIPADVCLTLLLGAAVGRVAFLGDDGRQELMPVNIVAVGKEIYFRTSPTGPLAVLATGRSNVAFGIDHFDATTGQGWNVTAWGETARVEDAEAARRAEVAGLTMPWAGGERHLIVAFTIAEIDGRRVSRI